MCELRHDHAHSTLKSRLSLIRSWSAQDEHETLVDSPAGAIELDDADLAMATGGLMSSPCGCTGRCSHHCGSAL
jgi:hypothetical protein